MVDTMASALQLEQGIMRRLLETLRATPSQPVALEFLPEKPGEYGFQCRMGMLRGKLIVE